MNLIVVIFVFYYVSKYILRLMKALRRAKF